VVVVDHADYANDQENDNEFRIGVPVGGKNGFASGRNLIRLDRMIQGTISDESWAQYERDGYVILGRLEADMLKRLQDRIDAIMLGEADLDYDKLLMQLDSSTGNYEDAGEQSTGHKGSTLDYRKIQNLEIDPLFEEYLSHPLFQDICRRVYGPGCPIALFRAMFMNKPANKGTFLASGPLGLSRPRSPDHRLDRDGPRDDRQWLRPGHTGKPHRWTDQSRTQFRFSHPSPSPGDLHRGEGGLSRTGTG